MQNQGKGEKQQEQKETKNNQQNNNIANSEHYQQNHSQNSERSNSSKSSSSRSYSSRSNSLNNNQQHVSKQPKQGQLDPATKKQHPQNAPQRKIRYKYCCKICKHTDKAKKACVCVVPKNQRRTQIGQQGCQTCGCNGCSKQDFISRGQDPQYKPGQKTKRIRRDRERQSKQFEARNGCCRKCMKAFSKSNKSCLCQVPEDVRNTKLPSSGCKICGCFGCNPQDKKDPRNPAKKNQRERSRSRQKRKKIVRSKSSSSYSRQYIDPTSMNFYNVEKSVIGSMIINQYRIDPAILGFGVPQRTHNYIIGKPK